MDIFQKHPLFFHLTPEDLATVQKIAKTIFFEKGQPLIVEGTLDYVLYIVLEGNVNIVKKEGDASLLLGSLTVGQTVGDLSIITNKPQIITVLADTKTQALFLDLKVLKNDPATQELYTKLLHNLVEEFSKILSPQHVEKAASPPPSSLLLLFGWKWKDIIYEIPFLAEHGFDAIKIYPPQEFILRTGHPWWEIYQPVSYHLSHFYGTEDDFKSMINLCHSFNIKVYADLVMNHMAEYTPKEETHVGTNGHSFTPFHYESLNPDGDCYEKGDFYQYAEEENLPQVGGDDYKKLERTWHLEHHQLLNLPKLTLKNTHVTQSLRKYAQSLLNLGIDGFRVDATKHLDIESAQKVLTGLVTLDEKSPFIYLEYFTGMPEGIDIHSYMSKYFHIGHVTSFDYGDFLSNVILKKGPNTLQSLVEFSFGSAWVQFPENKTVVVLDNHDTERYLHERLNYKFQEHNAYTLAYIFMLSWPFGVPKIMSGFRFSNHDDPFPETPPWQNGHNTCFDEGSPWVCQHRWNAIANMVLFRKKTEQAKGITHIWLNGHQIAFARTSQKPKQYIASIGFVVINNTDQVLEKRFETGLPDGKYVDMIQGKIVQGRLEGPKIEVSHYGYAEIRVNPYDAVVLCAHFVE